ncbi:MAG: hypothetical protein GY750_04890 [Lentisphaerae bacterium]|nr:hypothetical protein [Lentisphaerota bacterium]
MLSALIKHEGQRVLLHSMAEIAPAGDLLAQTGHFGTKNAGEGFMVMAVCQPEAKI